MTEYGIKGLRELLSSRLGPTREILNIDVKKMPQKGFGSVMLKIKIYVKNKNGSEETIHTVAKILPESDFAREVFNIQVTYKNEIAFYDTVLPALRNFQKENGITDVLDSFAEFYGARINLDENSDEVTDDAILILENLIESGYTNIDRKIGFNMETTKLILRDLAKFHGTSIGLKLKQPKVFEEKVKATCATLSFDTPDTPPCLDKLRMILMEDPKCVPLADKATSLLSKKITKPREPYATFVHFDLWVNNTMQKFEDGKAVKNKFVDFQICDYRSCAVDVFFFLWTSVQRSIIEEDFDYLVLYYHDHLVRVLKELKCDTSQFSKERFYEDFEKEAGFEFGHALMFALMVKAPSGNESSDGTEEFAVLEEIVEDTEAVVKALPKSVKDYVCYMTLECHRRGWVY